MLKQLFITLFCVFIASHFAKSQEIFFADPEVEVAVISQGYDTDFSGTISFDEALNVYALDLSNTGFFTLTDLFSFPSLTELNVSNNFLIETDFSIYNSISVLTASNCNLTQITLPLSLSSLDVSFNNLSKLDLQGQSFISYVNVLGNSSLSVICVDDEQDISFMLDSESQSFNISEHCCPFTVNVSTSQSTCESSPNGRIYFNSSPNNNASWTLDGDIIPLTGLVDFLPENEYQLVATVDGCSDTVITTVDFTSAFSLNLGSDTSLCSSALLELSIPDNLNSVLWNDGEVSYNRSVFAPSVLNVQAVDPNGCYHFDTITTTSFDCEMVLSPLPAPCISPVAAHHVVRGADGSERVSDLSACSTALGISGYTYSTAIDIGSKKHSSNGNQDVYFSRINLDGTIAWSQFVGTASTDHAGAIALSDDGTSVVSLGTGGNVGTITLGGQTFGLNGSLVIGKLDSEGNLIWKLNNSVSGTGIRLTEIELSQNDTIYGIGRKYNEGFSLGGVTIGDGDLFTVKISPDGTVLSSFDIDASNIEEPDFDVDASGNIYVTATALSGTIKLNSNETRTLGEGRSQFVVKYAPNGDVLWFKSFGESGIVSNVEIEVDQNGHAYIAGYFYPNSLILGNEKVFSINSTSSSSGYIAQLDSENGNVNWAQSIYNESHLVVGDLEVIHGRIVLDVLSNGDFYVDGFHYADNSNIILAENGDVISGNSMGAGSQLALTDMDNLWSAGSFSNTYDFANETLVSTGFSDLVVTQVQLFDIKGSKNITYELCENENVSVFVGDDSFVELDWSVDETTTNRLNAFSSPETITIRRKDNEGCWSARDTLNIEVFDNPVITLPTKEVLSPGQSVVLSANDGGDDYKWSTGEQDSFISVDYSSLATDTSVYWVVVNNSNCEDSSSIIVVKDDLITMLSKSDSNDFDVYPNPTEGEVSINFPNTSLITEWRIRNMKGEIRQKNNIQVESTFSVNIESYDPGIYLLECQSNSRVYVTKIIKR